MRSFAAMGTDTAADRAVHDAQALADAIDAVRLRLNDVAALLPEPQGQPRLGTIGRHTPGGSEPWQGAAAAVYWTIHFGVRRLEEHVRTDIGLEPATRGGSATNTREALTAIANAAAAMSPTMLATCRRRAQRWANAIDQLPDIDQADMWVPVPRNPGNLPPACPYCHLFTLRMAVRRGLIRCFNPACRDNNDNPPVARMEQSRLNADGLLVFGDGTVIHYREAA
jgi:hypothetical protein